MSESRALTVPEAREMAEIFAASGMFTDVKEMAQAFVKIQAGQEIGVQPFAAMTGIHIIKGKPTLGAGLIAGRIKGSGKYDYRVHTMDDDICIIVFYQGKQEIGESRFAMEDAKAAGLTSNPTWKAYPKNMLFARAMSNGARWYCPDIFNGSVYTPEEMGADVEIIEGEAHVVVSQRQQLLDDVDAVAEKHHGPEAGYQARHMDDKPTPGPHWIDDPKTRERFWAWARNDMGLTEHEIYQALRVDSVHKVATKQEALDRIDAYMRDRQEEHEAGMEAGTAKGLFEGDA